MLITRAQVTSLYQNFDVPCVISPYFPANWLLYNPIPATTTYGGWTCTSSDGNHHTPGMKCSGYNGSSFTVDTSFLITPMMNFHNYLGHNVYLRFDTKTSNIYNGSKLSLIRTPLPDSAVTGSTSNFDLGENTYPLFSSNDSIGWVTHEINLTPAINFGNFYLAIMYTSSPTAGSVWYIDNILTDTLSMTVHVPEISDQLLPLKVVGISTRNEITISYSAPLTGTYHLAIYDMVGREVHTELLNARQGITTYPIKGLELHSGMYCIKMGDGITYGIAKAMIQ